MRSHHHLPNHYNRNRSLLERRSISMKTRRHGGEFEENVRASHYKAPIVIVGYSQRGRSSNLLASLRRRGLRVWPFGRWRGQGSLDRRCPARPDGLQRGSQRKMSLRTGATGDGRPARVDSQDALPRRAGVLGADEVEERSSTWGKRGVHGDWVGSVGGLDGGR